jgi:hypothetical protein
MIKLLIAFSLFFTSEIHAQQSFNKLNVKELDVTSRVNVISTTKSSKPCPVMTETQRNAIASPLTGSCIYNSTALQLNIYDGSAWQSAGGGGIENWLTATSYEVDDVVIESNKIYQCEIAHTSGTFATDLAASRWVELSAQQPVNLTGPITSVGAATSIASQTGTGSTFVVQNSPTLTTPNIGAATGTSLTLAGNISAYNYDKDNLLINGNIENPLGAEWTCTVGTCTRTTTTGEFSKDTAALKISLSAQAMNVSQTVTTPSGIQKQGYARVIYRVPATMADFQICSLVDAAEQTCVPTANLIKDDTFRSIEIPLTFGTTSAGIKFKTTSSYTANAYFDGAIVAQGLGTQNLMTDYLYSAQIDGNSSPSTVSDENKDWLNGNCTRTATGIWDCPVIAGTFTAVPNCFATRNIAATAAGFTPAFDRSLSTTTNLRFHLANELGTAVNSKFDILCQKSGNDYLASSANVYSAASANYDWTDSGLTTASAFVGFGTPTFVNIKKMRIGSMMYLKGSFTSGTQTSTEYRLPIPDGLTVASSAKLDSNSIIGTWSYSAVLGASANYYMGAANGNAYVKFFQHTTATGYAVINTSGPMPGSGSTYYVDIAIPIAEWSNSNIIVGSFAGIEKCAGDGLECIDTFSANISSAGVVSRENYNWINGNTTGSGTYTGTFNSGIFTTTPNCNCTASESASASRVCTISSLTTSGFTAYVTNSLTGATVSEPMNLSCQRTGVDYKPKTAKVASSIGVPTVPGITTEAIDTFSVSYGTTNATTNCSASPCSYLDQIGTAVTSVTRASTGLYTLNTSKTYTKLKCSSGGFLTGGTDAARFTTPLRCDSCSALAFTTANQAGTVADTAGTILCTGSY